jgi:hypothetical protein
MTELPRPVLVGIDGTPSGLEALLDVLVLGSRRFGPLLGSVSSLLIDRAACPVVIVPRGVHAEAADVAAEEVTHA